MVAQTFSWDQFQTNRDFPKEDTGLQQPTPEPERSKDLSWGNFENTSTYQGKPDPTADESTFGYLIRNIAGNTARAAEGFLGKYGNVQKVVQDVLAKNPGSMGFVGTAIHNLMGEEKWNQMIYGREGSPLNPQLPTSEELKGVTESLTGEYLKPKTKGEKRFQEFSGDVGSIAGIGLPGQTAVTRIANKVLIPGASNVAKNAVEDLGFGEKAGSWTKLATNVALTLLNNVNAPTYAANLMNQGRRGYGPNVLADIPRYENRIDRVARNMLQGDPRSALAQEQIAGIRNDMQNGQTSMANLMNRYDAINAAKRGRGLFELGRADRREAIRNINQVRDAVRQEIQAVGSVNPQALRSWENGVNAFSAIHTSNAITNAASRYIKDPWTKSVVTGLFGGATYKAPLLAGPAVVVAPTVHKLGQVAYRVWRDPTLSRYYWNAIRYAAMDNQGSFMKNFIALEKAYRKKYNNKSIKNDSKNNK